MTRDEAYRLINCERAVQSLRWAGEHDWGSGDCSSDGVDEPVKVAVLTEEVGEVARAMLDGDRAGLRRELVQVAAVAVAWLESL